MDIDPNVIISSIALIIAIIGVVVSAILTIQSNNLTRRDLSNRLRPWVKITGCKPEFVILENGDIKTWGDRNIENNPIKLVRVVTTYSNIGSTPCNIVIRFIHDNKQLERNSIDLPDFNKGNTTVLMHDTTLKKHIDVSYDDWKIKGSNNMFFGLWIRYNITDKLQGELGRVWKMYGGGNSIVRDWYEEKPIPE